MLIYGQKAAAMWIEGSSAYSHNEYTYSSEGPTRKTLAGPTPLLDKYGTKHIMCFICVARSLEVMPGCILTTTTSQKESQVKYHLREAVYANKRGWQVFEGKD